MKVPKKMILSTIIASAILAFIVTAYPLINSIDNCTPQKINQDFLEKSKEIERVNILNRQKIQIFTHTEDKCPKYQFETTELRNIMKLLDEMNISYNVVNQTSTNNRIAANILPFLLLAFVIALIFLFVLKLVFIFRKN